MLNASSNDAPQKLLPKSSVIVICLAYGFQACSCIVKAPATGAQHRLLLFTIFVAFWHGLNSWSLFLADRAVTFRLSQFIA